MEVGSLKVQGNLDMGDALLKAYRVETNAVSAYSVEATQALTTPKLTLNGKPILNVQELNTRVTFKGVGLDGTSKTYTQDVTRFLHDITSDLHVLVINTKLADAIPFKQMIIPLDLTTGSGTSAFDTTVIKTSSGYINTIVEINESDGKLQAKFTFDEEQNTHQCKLKST